MGHILIVAPNWIGDAVLSLPVIDEAGRLWPNSEITVLARTAVARILLTRKPAVKVLEYARGGGISRIALLLRVGRQLRRKRFQLALLLPNSLSSALMVWLAGIPQRVGYATDGRGSLLSHKIRSRRKERGLHQVDYYIHLLHSLGARRVDRTPSLQLDSRTVERASLFLRELGVDKDERIVGVHPGAAYGEAKRWFPERFASVLERLQKPGRRFLLFGGPGEEWLAQEIDSKVRQPAINLAGKTSVEEVLGLISQCDLFLSNDSGLMHVAAAFGIPQVALFGSTDPQKTAPLNDWAVVIHPKEVSCTPCFKSECPEDLKCMQAITVDQVVTAAEGLLHRIDECIDSRK